MSQAHRDGDGQRARLDEVSPHLAVWLSTELRRRRMSQRMLAVRSGVSHSTISRLITNSRGVNAATLLRIARALGLSGVEIGRLLSTGRPFGTDALVAQNPIERRLEHVLRADPSLGDAGIRRVLAVYRAVRTPALPADGRPGTPGAGFPAG